MEDTKHVRISQGDTVVIKYGNEYSSGGLGPCISVAIVNHSLKKGIIGVLCHYVNFEFDFAYLNTEDKEKFTGLKNKSNCHVYISGGQLLSKKSKSNIVSILTDLGFDEERFSQRRNKFNGIAEEEILEILISSKGEVSFDSLYEDKTEFMNLD